jgi:3-isopropylmalate dehydrogenase
MSVFNPPTWKIAVLSGDGIGPEVVGEAIRVLQVVAELYKHEFTFEEGLVGGAAYEKCQTHLPEDTISLCSRCGHIMMRAISPANLARGVIN